MNNMIILVILIIAVTHLVFANSCPVYRYEADPRSSFCHTEERKLHILNKLGFTEVPEYISAKRIPMDHDVIKRLIKEAKINNDPRDLDYIIIFPTKVENRDKKYTMTFNLSHLPIDISKENVENFVADVQFYHNGSYSTDYVSRITAEERKNTGLVGSYMTGSDSRKMWIALPVKDRLLSWYLNPNTLHSITIECNCRNDTVTISTEQNKLPYIQIIKQIASLPTRSICSNNNPSAECHKQSVHIDFADIGWGNWIIFPRNYTDHYCSGFCAEWYQPESTCEPKKASQALFIYWHKEALIGNVIPDMIVKECSCTRMVNIR